MKKKTYIEKHNPEIERRYAELAGILADKRRTFCGVGTRVAKMILNAEARESTVAAMYRTALEIEDNNIVAKQSSGFRRESLYARKEALILKLWEMCRENGVVAGAHKSGGKTRSIVFFELPGTEQVSWHTGARFVEDMPDYPYPWDGKINSTLGKIEGAVASRYRGKITAAIRRNRIPGAYGVLSSVLGGYATSMSSYMAWRENVAEIYRIRVGEADSYTKDFKSTGLYRKLAPVYADPERLSLHIVSNVRGKMTYRVAYGGKRMEKKVKDMDGGSAGIETVIGVVRTSRPDWIAGEGVGKAYTVAEALSPGFAFSIPEGRDGDIRITHPDGREASVPLSAMRPMDAVRRGCAAAVMAYRFDRVYKRYAAGSDDAAHGSTGMTDLP